MAHIVTKCHKKKDRFDDVADCKENEELQVLPLAPSPVGHLLLHHRHPYPRLEPLSDVEDYATNPSFLPEIVSSSKAVSINKTHYVPPQLSQFWIYGAGHGGSVEHWKKLARKAELEMHLEQEQHKSDHEKDLESIHRLRCRISALEAAAQDRDVMIENQRRKINSLKTQLGGANKRVGREISILKNESEHMQKKFASLTEVSEKKILELKEELQISESRAKVLDYQLCLVNKCIEEPLEMFNLTELPERAPESIQQQQQQASSVKVSKRNIKKHVILEPETIIQQQQGFDDFILPTKANITSSSKDMATELLKKKGSRPAIATKILQLRTENNTLVHTTSQLESELKLERDSLATLVHKLQQEFLADMGPRSVEGTAELETLMGGDQTGVDTWHDGRLHAKSNLKVDKELIHRIIMAVREQKKKLLITLGKIEELKKEKLSCEASVFKKQKELQRKLENFQTENDFLLKHFVHMQNLLGFAPLQKYSGTSSSSQQDREIELEEACAIREIVKKIEQIIKQGDEARVLSVELESENQLLHEQLKSYQNATKLLGIDYRKKSDDVSSQMQQLKQRRDDLEIFFREAFTIHEVMTKNLHVLACLVTEGLDFDDNMLYGMDFLENNREYGILLQHSFIKVVAEIPEIVYRVNALKNEQRDYMKNLHRIESEKEQAESRLVEQENLTRLSDESKRELTDTRMILENIRRVLISDKPSNESDQANGIDTGSTILQKLEKMKNEMETSINDAKVNKNELEVLKLEVSSAQVNLEEAVRCAIGLKEELLSKCVTNTKVQTLHGRIHRDSENEKFSEQNQTSLHMHTLELQNCLEMIQDLRIEEEEHAFEDISRLNHEMEGLRKQIDDRAKDSATSGSEWREKLVVLSGDLDRIKQEKQQLTVELSSSCLEVEHLNVILQKSQEELTALIEQKNLVSADLEKLKLINSEQNVFYENIKRELMDKIDALEKEISRVHADRAGSVDSAESLHREIVDNKRIHEQASKQWVERLETLQESIAELQADRDGLKLEIKLLEKELKEKELMLENVQKTRNEDVNSLQEKLAQVSQECQELKSLAKDHESAASHSNVEHAEMIRSLERSFAQAQQDQEILGKELEQAKESFKNYEATNKLHMNLLQEELLHLGGSDVMNEVVKKRRQAASLKVKEILAVGTSLDPLSEGKDPILNPLRKLVLFQVDFLVNSKAQKQLEVSGSGSTGGLSQAAVHYFSINQQTGDLTFEHGNPPGSQSSNIIAELMLSANEVPIYETKAGDILGLSVKVKSMNDRNAREILYNTNVIRTDEIMEAIKGQSIDNFSLWPDLVSSWKWERSKNKGQLSRSPSKRTNKIATFRRLHLATFLLYG